MKISLFFLIILDKKQHTISMKRIMYIVIAFVFCFITFGLNESNPKSICYSLDDHKYVTQIQSFEKYEIRHKTNQNVSGSNQPKIIFSVSGKDIYIENIKEPNISIIQQKIIDKGFNAQVHAMNFAVKNGLSILNAIDYAFPSIKIAIDKISDTYGKEPIDAKAYVIPNSAKLDYENAKTGVKINKNAIYLNIFNEFNNYNNLYKFKIDLEMVDYSKGLEDVKNETKLKSEFKTYYGSSSTERKNNINIALKALDGIIINPGEILSFNTVTGLRNEKNGYKKAKIIKQGSFSQEYGGGVCQVSTTLYNCALLADLEIIEVNPHSLPVSYIEPSFDAMVNSGSSDLKIKNTTNKPIYIATSGDDEFCKICMFGVQNVYKIVKNSKKTHIFANFEKIETTDYKAYGYDKALPLGERKTISSGKEGYESVGILEYYIDDVLVKTKQIRKNKYSPTKEVVLVGVL